jgi:hypothetical protein
LQADAKVCPLGAQAVHRTQCLCPKKLNIHLKQHCLNHELSSIILKDVLPLHVNNGLSVLRSQNLTVVSPEPLANCLPSGLKLTEMTASECPGNELKNIFILIILLIK